MSREEKKALELVRAWIAMRKAAVDYAHVISHPNTYLPPAVETAELLLAQAAVRWAEVVRRQRLSPEEAAQAAQVKR